MKLLTEEEFDQHFTAVPDLDGGLMRSNHEGIDPLSDKLWTIVDGDDGGLYAVSGQRGVNQVAYLLTEESWTEDTEAVWFPASDEDEDEEDLGEDSAPGYDDFNC